MRAPTAGSGSDCISRVQIGFGDRFCIRTRGLMLPGDKRDAEKQGKETEHDAAIRHLTEQTGITEADCGKWLLDVPISASSAYGASYFVYQVSRWEWTTEMLVKTKQSGLESEWVKFSKADEQASVKPGKWRRWSAARREEHRGKMWDHARGIGAGQVQVQAGTGQVEVAKECSGAQMQKTGEAAVTKEVGAARETRSGQQASGQVWETPEGGIESSGGEQSREQGPKWRAEESTSTETIFRSLSRKR